jgi:hypothetical protein
MPQFIEDHPEAVAARANAELRAAGVTDLRFDTPVFRSRRAMAETGLAIEAVLTAPEATPAPAAGPTPAEAIRARAVDFLRLGEARSRPAAALAMALRTDATVDAARRLLAALPVGAALDLPVRSIEDADAKREAGRIEGIVAAAAGGGQPGQAVEMIEAGITQEAATAILAAMPRQTTSSSFEERVSGGDWFGEAPAAMEDLGAGRSVASGWSKAVAKANARFEAATPATPTMPAAPAQGEPHEPNL